LISGQQEPVISYRKDSFLEIPPTLTTENYPGSLLRAKCQRKGLSAAPIPICPTSSPDWEITEIERSDQIGRGMK
jgi:hypothetical protein